VKEEKRKFLNPVSKNQKTMEEAKRLLKNLIKDTIEEILESEMDYHLGYEKNSYAGNNSGNNRNGYNKKTLSTQLGKIQIRIPRDRNGKFAPQVLSKYQTKSKDIDKRILTMFAEGMSANKIEDRLLDIYGTYAPEIMIRRIKDRIISRITQLQSIEYTNHIVFLYDIVIQAGNDSGVIHKYQIDELLNKSICLSMV
jgi:transposase-like protein